MIVTTTTAIDGRQVSECVGMVARPGREHALMVSAFVSAVKL